MRLHGDSTTGAPPPPLPRRQRQDGGGAGIGTILARASAATLFVLVLLVVLPIWMWFACRIEPGQGEIAILIRKTGEPLPSGEMLALKPNQKGIQLEVLPEGRYFPKNPYTWSWEIDKITDIPGGRLGVQTRLYGQDLPPGQIIAGPNTKGILQEVLRPGKYRVNPYAFHIQMFDAISIRPGCVGVMTSLIGQDVLDDKLPAEQRNTFLVTNALKGVVGQVLDPGSYYLNPYVYNVVEVNLQSQRFELSGDDAINFLTLDGFTVTVEGTLEFALQRDHAALLTHRVGDMDDIVKKIVLPRARGFSRIEGSKNPAINYIVGETRQLFQNNLETHLREQCRTWGVTIKSVLIRNIKAPEEIASIIRDREVAVQDAKKFDQQTEQARSKAELAKQEMLAVQNKAKVEANTTMIRAIIQAKQEMAVKLTAAKQQLEVARLENDAAAFQAQAIERKAEAEGAVVRMDNEAQSSVISNQVAAFGSGLGYARYAFYQQVAPRIGSLLTSDDADGFGNIFAPLLGGTVAAPGATSAAAILRSPPPPAKPVTARPALPGAPAASATPATPRPAPPPVVSPPLPAAEAQKQEVRP